MVSRRVFLSAALGTAAVTGTAACSVDAPGTDDPHVVHATAVTEVYGGGLRLSAVVLEYDADIDTATLSASAYTVSDHRVVKVYANASPERSDVGRDGKYVVVEVSTSDIPTGGADAGEGEGDDEGAAFSTTPAAGATGTTDPAHPRQAAATTTSGSTTSPTTTSPTTPSSAEAPASPSGSVPASAMEQQVTVVQVGDVTTVDGATYPGGTEGTATDAVENLVVDDFAQATYTHTATGTELRYNLFTPEGADQGTSYPLVVFVHDEGTDGTTTTSALTQGLGAVSWADPDEQQVRPAFVLAPQFTGPVVGTDLLATSQLQALADLVDHVVAGHAVDPARIYLTGQSTGATAVLALHLASPGTYAAVLLVAGLWDTPVPVPEGPVWTVAAQGDAPARAAATALVRAMRSAGATVATDVWSGRWSDDTLGDLATALGAKDADVTSVTLKKGTVVTEGFEKTSENEHTHTWRLAYRVPELRAWMFDQSR